MKKYAKDLGVLLAGILIGGLGFQLNYNYKINGLIKFATANNCVYLGPPQSDTDLSKYVTEGYGCGIVILTIPKIY